MPILSARAVVSKLAEPVLSALDGFTGAVQASTSSLWTGVNHTVGAGVNYALVIVSHETSVASIAVTFGGVTMNVGAIGGPADGTLQTARLFWLDASTLPGEGVRSVVVDPATSITGYVGIWTLKGRVQGVPNRTDDGVANTAISVTATLASVPANAFVASGSNNNDTAAVTLSGGTERYSDNTASGAHRGVFADSQPGSLATITHTYTGIAVQRRAVIMAEILAS